MAAAAELRLLEKSLGLKPGNKYSAQGERQVRRSGRKAAGRRGDLEPTRPGRDTRVDSTLHVRVGQAAWLELPGKCHHPLWEQKASLWGRGQRRGFRSL